VDNHAEVAVDDDSDGADPPTTTPILVDDANCALGTTKMAALVGADPPTTTPILADVDTTAMADVDTTAMADVDTNCALGTTTAIAADGDTLGSRDHHTPMVHVHDPPNYSDVADATTDSDGEALGSRDHQTPLVHVHASVGASVGVCVLPRTTTLTTKPATSIQMPTPISTPGQISQQHPTV